MFIVSFTGKQVWWYSSRGLVTARRTKEKVT